VGLPSDAPNSTETALDFGDHQEGSSMIYRRGCLNADSRVPALAGIRSAYKTFHSKFLAMLVMLTVSMQLVAICAAQTKSDPITTVTHVDIIPDAYKPQSEENAARLLRTQMAATQHDAGLLSYMSSYSRTGRATTSQSLKPELCRD